MGLSVVNNQNTGYTDIDNLNKQQNELYDKAYETQQNIINTQTQQGIDEINRNKEKLNDETTKQNQALYTDYTKQVNPYGTTAESLAQNGLANSGVAESTKTNLYNTYQKNRTNTLNTAKNILAEYDAQIAQAKQNGNIQLAQSALELYNQKIDNLYNTYQLLQNQKQFDYQKERDQILDNRWQQEFDYNKWSDDRNYNYQVDRDQVSDSQWQQQFDYNQSIDDRNYNYQVGRDNIADDQWKQEFDYNKWANDRNYNYQVERNRVADNQWQQEYDLQKKNLSNSSSRRSYSTGSRSSSNNELNLSTDNELNLSKDVQQKTYTPEEILNNITTIQGPNITNNIKDKISGKTFSSIDELMAYYGYANVE